MRVVADHVERDAFRDGASGTDDHGSAEYARLGRLDVQNTLYPAGTQGDLAEKCGVGRNDLGSKITQREVGTPLLKRHRLHKTKPS